ncbi:hypothetical protein Tco_0711186 [Tanacetum coccineum]
MMIMSSTYKMRNVTLLPGNEYRQKDINEAKVDKNRALYWKEHKITSPTVPSYFIRPARHHLYRLIAVDGWMRRNTDIKDGALVK